MLGKPLIKQVEQQVGLVAAADRKEADPPGTLSQNLSADHQRPKRELDVVKRQKVRYIQPSPLLASLVLFWQARRVEKAFAGLNISTVREGRAAGHCSEIRPCRCLSQLEPTANNGAQC
ncbi:hypothetical protein AOLI_G00305510 [Acnodon oligacanthus]